MAVSTTTVAAPSTFSSLRLVHCRRENDIINDIVNNPISIIEKVKEKLISKI